MKLRAFLQRAGRAEIEVQKTYIALAKASEEPRCAPCSVGIEPSLLGRSGNVIAISLGGTFSVTTNHLTSTLDVILAARRGVWKSSANAHGYPFTSRTVNATIDMHLPVSKFHYALAERIERLCGQIDALNQIKVQHNSHKALTVGIPRFGAAEGQGCW